MAKAASHSGKGTPDPIEAFDALSDAEKERVWQSFDRVIGDDETRPLTPDEEADWNQAVAANRGKRKPARPSDVGRGSRRIHVSVDLALLAKVDAYAKAHGLTRSQVFARGAIAELKSKA